MKTKRALKDLLVRATSLLLALYLLNYSIDTRDRFPDHVTEDLTFNDIESLLELSLECFAGIENAVEEHDEHDQEDGGAFEFNKLYFRQTFGYHQNASLSFIEVICNTPNKPDSLTIRDLEVKSPPPWS